MEPDQLQATIVAAQGGAPEAYEALLEAYGSRLYGYFLRAVGNHHDAEDLLGEMTVRVVRRLKSYQDSGRFDHWLFRIAANLVRDRIRRLRVRPRVASLSAEGMDGASMADRLPGPAAAVDSGLTAAEASTALNRALDALDESTRQMILLRHFAEMTFKEIAAIYDCPIGTVLARVHRGVKSLRRIMEDDDRTD
jgi:RNA polymerase sigma-70 factor (ECF subfamily)